MSVRRSRGVPRSGFTLIELLIVVTIIAILVSLAAGAVMTVLIRIPEVQTRTEIAEMDAALGAFMADYNLTDPPPSTLTLYSSVSSYPPTDPTLAFLKKAFGKNIGASGAINWGGTADGVTLSGEQCLVFYLGGIGGTQGFSYNNINPGTPGGKRHGPYFTFQASRFVAGAGGYNVYIDGWKGRNAAPMPYAYFSSGGYNNGYALPAVCGAIPTPYGARPYLTAVGQYINSNKYQIISAGRFGKFGNGAMTGGGPATGDGKDDQANFSSTFLGVGLN